MENSSDILKCNERSCHRAFLKKSASDLIMRLEVDLIQLDHDGLIDPSNLSESDRNFISLSSGIIALRDYAEGLGDSCGEYKCAEPDESRRHTDELLLSSTYVAAQLNIPMTEVLLAHFRSSNRQPITEAL